jgi:hypothetical protein
MPRVTDNIELLLITGAGASTAFGGDRRPLPMMAEFNDAIIRQLGAKPGFQVATGLTGSLEGHEFERKLGLFLQATRSFPQIEQLLEATSMFPDVPIDKLELKRWYDISQSQLTQITQDIFRVTYDQFAPERVAITSAQAAYARLLQMAGLHRGQHRLVVATTNYDTIADRALGAIRWHAINGAHEPGEEVDVEGLLDGGTYSVPVLHLHGCLGWYRQVDRNGATRVISTNNSKYDPDFGDPVVLLPEPNKDYDADPVIRTIWDQFREALRAARRVLMIGHSLNDEKLLADIRDNANLQSVGVTVADLPGSQVVMDIIRAKLPGAHDIRMMFDEPLPKESEGALDRWLSDTRMSPDRIQPPASPAVL